MFQRVKLFIYFFNTLSLVVWAWIVIEFFSHTIHVPASLSALYLTLVGVYVGDKEYQRVRKKLHSRNRRGELFVLLWLATLIIITAVVSLGGYGNGYRVPEDLPIISGTVLVLWLTSEYIKGQHRRRS